MQVSTVRADDTATTAAASKPELFEGHYVQDGKVVRTWGEAMFRTSISSLQEKYDAANASTNKEEGYSLMTPFNFVGGIFSSVFAFLGTMVSSILGICGYGGEEAAVEAGKEQPNDAKKA